MCIRPRIMDTAPRESGRELRESSLAFHFALIGVLVLGFFLRPTLAQRPEVYNAPTPNSAADANNPTKPVMETYDQVQLRNAPRGTPGSPRSSDKESTCLLPPLSRVSTATVTTTSLQIPAKARKEYEEACGALKDKQGEKAGKHLRKAVQEYPKYSAAWVTLGQLLATRQQSEAARTACSQGLTVDASYVPAYLCLADIAAREKAWDEVLKLSGRALELDPSNNAVAYEYNAAANLRLNRLADAEKSALKAVEIDKNNTEPRVHFVLAQIYEAKHDRANEAAQLREYLKFADNPDDAAMVKQYLSQLEQEAEK